MRLDKLLAHTGFGTRKEVKKIIRDQYVSVNGEIVRKSGKKVDPDKDDVRISGERIYYEEFVYFMLNKPAGVISATEDYVHDTVIDLLEPADSVQEPHPVGRLDKDTEGLLLLTNDGKLTHQLTSPKKEVDKKYYAFVTGLVNDADIKKFKEGILLEEDNEDYLTLPANLEVLEIDEEANTSEVHVVIHEGKFHQVKRMFHAVDKEVLYLKRIAMGELQLDENLALGDYRRLTTEELETIKKQN
ncbi:MAG: rRNA pseudouridine synthase [Atopostipes suicloacalis]|nr:rRNA pseudouridine synthase [Atopostipes suicloacalis]